MEANPNPHRPKSMASNQCPDDETLAKLVRKFFKRKNGGSITAGRGVKYTKTQLLIDLGYAQHSTAQSPLKGIGNFYAGNASLPKIFNKQRIYEALQILVWDPPFADETPENSDSDSDSKEYTSEEGKEEDSDDGKLVIQISQLSLVQNHYIYIFVGKFTLKINEDNFSEFVKGLFYVGQGTGNRFHQHFGQTEEYQKPPLERVMAVQKTFFAAIIWTRLTKIEANYLERKLIGEALGKGKHLWGRHDGGQHECSPKYFGKELLPCLCNQQQGNNDADLPETNPHFNYNLQDAYKVMKNETRNWGQNYLLTNRNSPSPLTLSTSHRYIKETPKSPTVPSRYYLVQEKDKVYHRSIFPCEANIIVRDITGLSPCDACC